MQIRPHSHGLMASLRHILSHGAITLLAVVIAFALPSAARYILYDWWPLMEQDPNLLLASEVGLASVLVLLFNLAKVAWDGRHKVAMARLASLVHARHARKGWLARWRERSLVRRLPAARDAYILTQTGYDTLVAPSSALRSVLATAYEIRVMMVNPIGEGLRKRVESLSREITLLSFHGEIEASIAFLAELRKLGKKIALKFYDEEPFWKLVVLGEHVWVQHCHSGFEVSQQPEYVFALDQDNPRMGFFVPFYMHFLNLWNDARHPEYDFDSNELVYRDGAGNEQKRSPLGVPISGALPASS